MSECLMFQATTLALPCINQSRGEFFPNPEISLILYSSVVAERGERERTFSSLIYFCLPTSSTHLLHIETSHFDSINNPAIYFTPHLWIAQY
jgi:hypothetical protein